MKLVFASVLLFAAMISIAYAVPVDDAHEFIDLEVEYEGDNQGIRQRRVTCDLLNFAGGIAGDSACAANCLSMGKAGGRCNNGICQCRTTTSKDLWDRRFGR